MSQTQKIHDYLKTGEAISGLIARQLFGTEDLPKRISELRKAGVKINVEIRRDLNGKRYGSYTLSRNG